MVKKVKDKIKEKVFPMKFPLNPFAGTPESLEKVINRLPTRLKEQSAQEFDKMMKKLYMLVQTVADMKENGFLIMQKSD